MWSHRVLQMGSNGSILYNGNHGIIVNVVTNLLCKFIHKYVQIIVFSLLGNKKKVNK